MIKLLLFGTQGCHLCEDAERLIYESQSINAKVTIEYIDIAEHEQWQERYAVRIPVLLHPESGDELGWPFDQVDVNRFVLKQ